MRRSIFPSLYTVIGIVMAINYGYGVFTSISAIISFILAVMIWPALLLGLSLRVNFGF